VTVIKIGKGELEYLTNILEVESFQRIFLIHGHSSSNIITEKFGNGILGNYVDYIRSSSPIMFADVYNGVNSYNENGCDLIVCIGGGSIIDFGKLVSIFSINKFPINDYVSGQRNYISRSNKLICLPTTAGSGSEATHFAVLYNGLTKYSISDKSLLPDYSIIDSELTYSLPSKQTAISGLDALSQAIESYWNINSTTESEYFSEQAINLILPNLEKAVNSPDNTSREKISQGSYLSGKAINLTKTTAPHALSYPLTLFFGIPHGHAVSLTLSSFLEYNYNTQESNLNDPRGMDFLMKKMNNLIKLLNSSNVNEAKNNLNQLIKSLGLHTTLKPLGISSSSDIKKIVDNINFQRLSNNPRIVRKSDSERILKHII